MLKISSIRIVTLLATVMPPAHLCYGKANSSTITPSTINHDDLKAVIDAIKRQNPSDKREFPPQCIGYNSVVGAILSESTSLDLSGSGIKRLPISAIALMDNLIELDISDNPDLRITANDIKQMSKTLTTVKFASSHLTEEGLRSILAIPSLMYLDISNNDLSAIFSGCEVDVRSKRVARRPKASRLWRGLLRQFRNLLARRSQAPSTPQKAPLRLNNLRGLKARVCNLDGTFLKKISRMENLKYLDLSGNKGLGKDMPADLGLLKNTLTKLSLEYCGMTQDSFRAVCMCENLEFLDVCSNWDIWEGQPENLLNNLKDSMVELRVAATNMTPAALEEIRNFTRMLKLDISDNLRVGPGIGSDFDFKRLKSSLRELNASRVNMQSPGIKAICTLERLEKLGISGIWEPWDGITADDFISMKHTLKELNVQDCCIDSRLILDIRIVLYKANIILNAGQASSPSSVPQQYW